MAGVESNYWHQVALWRREMLQIGDSTTSQLQILQMLKMLQIGGHSLRERVANWRRRILRWPHRLSQGRLAHCDRLRDGRTTTSALLRCSLCILCTYSHFALSHSHRWQCHLHWWRSREQTSKYFPFQIRSRALGHRHCAPHLSWSSSNLVAQRSCTQCTGQHKSWCVSTHSFLSTFPSLLWSETLHKFGFNAFPVSSVLTSPSQGRSEDKMAKVTTLTFVWLSYKAPDNVLWF